MIVQQQQEQQQQPARHDFTASMRIDIVVRANGRKLCNLMIVAALCMVTM